MSNRPTAVVDRDAQNYRLPTAVTPDRYDIKLTPDLQKFTFAGEMRVSVTVHEATTQIVVNAVELEIQQVSIKDESGNSVEGKATLDEKSERVTFAFPQPLKPGKSILEVKFTGILNDKLNGFYRSTYKDASGNQKVLATTQFEATDARKAFPCWDEPQHKAVFGITLVVDKPLTAISNASIKSEKEIPGTEKKEVIFNDSIKMSTYLVAFIVGEFESSEPVMSGKTPIRIWSVPGKNHLAPFASQIGKAALDFFAKYYGIDYPGDKLDQIAIPDFASGAMENLGAVTYRETALLVDEKTATHAEQERVADVVAHELAHMWFGDLVTMKWWNGLWLNEAFATFMEMLAVDNWKPQWKRWESFGVSRAAAFAVDGLQSTRPIEFPVNHPDEASAMFDVLTYEKGASVLRMLEQYLGAEEFRKGIANYLKKHEFANAETTDLWDAIEESTKQPVREMMDTWIFQGGYPMVSVDATADGVTLSQQRFYYLSEGERKEQLFHVPVMIRAKTDKGEVRKKVLLTGKEMKLDLGGKVDWIVVNEGGHGFYRVRYSPELLSKLTANLTQVLQPIERFGLVSDTWASTVAGHTPLNEYLKMVALFKDETDKNVWTVLTGSMVYLNRIIDKTQRPAFESFVRQLLSPPILKLTWEPQAGEDELTKQLRSSLIATIGTIGNCPKVQAKAKEVYAKYKADRSSVDPNLVPALVNIVAFTGDEKIFEEFTREFKEAKTPQEEIRYLFALAGFADPNLLKKTLEKALTDEIRTQNAPYLVQSVMANVYGREDAWKFFQENWDKMIKLYPENSIPRMCEGVTALTTPELQKQVKEFFTKHEVKQGGKTIDQHLERLHVAVLFQEREKKNFASAFS
jgi:puromycin-sensitive aminopeptidase